MLTALFTPKNSLPLLFSSLRKNPEIPSKDSTISHKMQFKETVDIPLWNGLFSMEKGRWTNASILYEMSYQEGNERHQGYNNEEWEAGNSRRVPRMRDKDVQDRQELKPLLS
jgi:hypothetical protein